MIDDAAPAGTRELNRLRVLEALLGHAAMGYARLSTGVGVGLVLDGRPYRGGAGLAGELGHVAVLDGGPICRCKLRQHLLRRRT